jgi:hypothetical protein
VAPADTAAMIPDRLLDLLLGREVPVPEETHDLLPPGVRIRAGRWIPALGGILGRMRGPAAAVTLGRNIVVHPAARLTRRLLAHELEHVRQWERERWFPLRYCAESLRRGYFSNVFEQQARSAELTADLHPPDPERLA